MAERLKVKSGTKVQLACDVQAGGEPEFNLISTFYKALDDSAFLISVPMQGGKPMELDESLRLLLRFGSGSGARIVAGYADDLVQEGIRRYWKIRRVSELRQFVQRADERFKIALHVQYKQDTWPVNSEGTVTRDEGLTLDISNGGVAVYLSHRFQVGEICQLTLPRIGTSPDGREQREVVGVVCWEREAPKGSPFIRYVDNVRKKCAM